MVGYVQPTVKAPSRSKISGRRVDERMLRMSRPLITPSVKGAGSWQVTNRSTRFGCAIHLDSVIHDRGPESRAGEAIRHATAKGYRIAIWCE